MSNLEQKVSELREKSNKSLMSLAKDIDANYETLKSQLRSGNLNATWLLKISHVLNFSIDDLRDELLIEWIEDFKLISSSEFLSKVKLAVKPETFAQLLSVYKKHGEKYASDLYKVAECIDSIFYDIDDEEEFAYPIGGLGSHSSTGYYMVLADQYLKDIPETIDEKSYFKEMYDKAFNSLYEKYGEEVHTAVVVNRYLYLRSAVYFKIEGVFWEALLAIAKEGKYHTEGELLKDIIVKLKYIEQEVSKAQRDEKNITNVINNCSDIKSFLSTFQVKDGAVTVAYELIKKEFERLQKEV